ncbi:hypothetical protein [Aquimarina algiphila]|uniref:hypothetical protein n=1 Tax=Aquimarina algiphila TaxID=2047982 RepID=UPI00233052BA|nr:hypothetical protein [Aquimarina algiphila]
MEKYLEPLGITEFKNAKYVFKPVEIDLWGEKKGGTLIEIENWELEGGYRYLEINANINDAWTMAFSAGYMDDRLFEKTKIGDDVGKHNFHTIDLHHMDGFSELDSYFYTSDYNDSIHVLNELLMKFGNLELDKEEEKDLSNAVYIPFDAMKTLKNHLLVKIKDFSSEEEIEEVTIAFMENQGEEYRSDLYSDSKLIYKDDFWENEELKEHYLHEQIEDFIQMNFDEDEVFFDDFL